MKASTGVAPEVLPLPKGGGAIRSIGDTFSPDLHTGTGTYEVPIWCPRGPGGFQPGLRLVYSTAAGNGPFGMGWRLPVTTIARSTDHGVPSYGDADVLLLDGEQLAAVGGGVWRARVESQFRRVRALQEGWEVTDRGGRRFLLGTAPEARVEDTTGAEVRTFAWHLERAIDTHGNEITYRWRHDGGHLYLDAVAYGPYEIRFLYEQRPDASEEHRAGFPLSMALRCSGIQHRLPADAAPVFRSYSFGFDECPFTRLSLLATVEHRGHPADAGGGTHASLPRLRFSYTPFEPGHRYRPFRSRAGIPPSEALDKPELDLVDLDADGLPGVVEVHGPVRRYWPNRGGTWAPPRELRRLPASLDMSDPGTAFADMNGDGAADVVLLSEAPLGYLRNEPGEGFAERARFAAAPAVDPGDPNVRLVDLNGDGLVDLLHTAPKAFYAYLNRGERGWDPPFAIARRHDLAQFPDLFLADPRVRLADMNGDGLVDLAWVHGGRIDYWPALGGARFGARVSLAVAPSLSEGFAPQRLFIVDVNGDGRGDVVYVERDRVRIWINRNGRSLVAAGQIRHTPPLDGENVRVADMLGSGTAGLLWSYPASRRDPGNYKYLDFASGGRPYLLRSIDNGVGMTTEIEYETSTSQSLAARERGTPWATTLPFPVSTVARIIQRDAVSGLETRRRIRYFDGLYERREFRGFGRAEVLEEGDAEVPGTLTVSHFHQGRRGVTPGASAEERGALTGRLRAVEVFEVAPDGSAGRPFRREESSYDVRALAATLDGGSIVFPSLAESVTFLHEREPAPLVDRVSLTYDDHGNPVEKHERWDSGPDVHELVSRFRYTADTDRWILNLPVELQQADGAGRLLRLRRYFYDGDPFIGQPLGQVTRGDLSRCEDLVLTDAAVGAVYGPAPPDFAALGLHRVTAPDGQQGWARNRLRERFDARGNAIERMDGLGNVGSISFDADGIFPTSVSDPLGHSFASDYDLRAQQAMRIGEPNGAETRYRFDALGRLVAVVKPGDSDSLPTTEIEHLQGSLPLGVSTSMRTKAGQADTVRSVEYFDGLGNPVQMRSSAEAGGVIVDGARSYNRRGWEALRTVPFRSTGFAYVAGEGLDHSNPYRFAYDELGRVVETVTPDGRPAFIEYGLGEITRFDVSDTDDSPANVARGHFDTPRVELYDARGRLRGVRETEAGGATLETRYTLDPLGQLRAIVDARGVEVAGHRFDMLGRKVEVDHVDAGRRRVVYDARGDIVERIGADGARVAMRYDELRRILETEVGGASTERYTYDAGAGANLVGRLARVEDEAGEVRFSYTPRGLIAAKTRVADTSGGPRTLTAEYAYDSLERLTELTYPDGETVSYEYDGRGLLSRIPGVVDGLEWNAVGQLSKSLLNNGTVESYAFDPATFYLTEASVTGPARPEPYYHVSYDHDAVGNPLTITDEVAAAGHRRFTREFTYDALYRLTGVSADLDGTMTNRGYEYDAVGNFRRNEEFGGDELVLAGAGSNRIVGTVSSPALFGYDASGSLTSAPGRALDYDARGRLSRVTRSDGTVVEFAYGYGGERVRKRVTSGGQTTETLYFDDLFEVRDGQAIRVIRQEHRRIAQQDAAGTRFFHGDHLGNVVLVTDGSGAIVLERGYLPFGGTVFSSGAATPHGFIGNELDTETGLVYCASRYYDPALGRFVSPDPFALLNPERFLAMPASLNLYAYASNNPVRQLDDAGTFWKWVLGGLIIAALVVATIAVGVATGGAGFAFGILLAASIGSALGAGVGTYSAWQGGGDLADGFLLGALVGGAAGAAGFAVGAAVGAAGIGGVWGSILAGAAEGAVVGAANGAIIGYAGGKGSFEDVLLGAGIGFLTGAVLGGIAGWIKYNPSAIADKIKDFGATGSATAIDPATGAQLYEGYSTAPAIQSVTQGAGTVLQKVASATAYPVLYAGIGSTGQLMLTYHWDDIKAWLIETFGGEEETVTVSA